MSLTGASVGAWTSSGAWYPRELHICLGDGIWCIGPGLPMTWLDVFRKNDVISLATSIKLNISVVLSELLYGCGSCMPTADLRSKSKCNRKTYHTLNTWPTTISGNRWMSLSNAGILTVNHQTSQAVVVLPCVLIRSAPVYSRKRRKVARFIISKEDGEGRGREISRRRQASPYCRFYALQITEAGGQHHSSSVFPSISSARAHILVLEQFTWKWI